MIICDICGRTTSSMLLYEQDGYLYAVCSNCLNEGDEE